jgi:hypothetical protein
LVGLWFKASPRKKPDPITINKLGHGGMYRHPSYTVGINRRIMDQYGWTKKHETLFEK